MNITSLRTMAVIGLILAGPALAQSSTDKTLKLSLPPQDIPAAPASAHVPQTAFSVTQASQPGVYYGDASGPPAHVQRRSCDDSTYNRARVHGSVGMGVVAGDGFGGNYQTGTVNISKAFGSCEHPSGGIRFSFGVEQGFMNGPRWGR